MLCCGLLLWRFAANSRGATWPKIIESVIRISKQPLGGADKESARPDQPDLNVLPGEVVGLSDQPCLLGLVFELVCCLSLIDRAL